MASRSGLVVFFSFLEMTACNRPHRFGILGNACGRVLQRLQDPTKNKGHLMPARLVLRVAIACAAVGILTGGRSAQAQNPNSPRFVALLLNEQNKEIKSDTKALNTRDKDIMKLESATRPSQIKSLNNSLVKLHNQILSMTTKLQAFSVQVYTGATHLTPPSPTLKTKAFNNLLTVQTLSVRAGLGINPATPMQ
jgi:hypothetical protein